MTAPGVPNPEVLARIKGNEASIQRAVEHRMAEVGVEAEFIGMKGVPGVEEGGFTRYPAPQGGGNLRPDHPNVVSGQWKAGINVDEAIFDPKFEALAGEPRSRCPRCSKSLPRDVGNGFRCNALDAVIAHEYAELKAVSIPDLLAAYGNKWLHYAAVKNAPDTPLKISNEARDLLGLQRLALGLE